MAKIKNLSPVLTNQRLNPFIANRKPDPLWKEAVAEVFDILDSAFKGSTVEDSAVDFSLRLLVAPVTSVTRFLNYIQGQIQKNMDYRHEQEDGHLTKSIEKPGHDALSTAQFIIQNLRMNGLATPPHAGRFSRNGRFIEKTFSPLRRIDTQRKDLIQDALLDAMGRASVSNKLSKRKVSRAFLQEVQHHYNRIV